MSTIPYGKERHVPVHFGEATAEQQLQCSKLAASAFHSPLSETDYIEREKILSQSAISQAHPWRIWCLARIDDSSQVIATCKTVHRDLLVADATGIHERQGYCIASVVTSPAYRKQGLASELLKHVVEWMDGPGMGTANMLYTSIGDFYVQRGWEMHHVPHCILSGSPSLARQRLQGGIVGTRPLMRDDIGKLCEQDVENIKAEFARREMFSGNTLMTVLPTADLISGLHQRAEFTSQKTTGKTPHKKGAICGQTNTWVYWCHDFRKNQLGIQRFGNGAGKGSRELETEALASLLLDALDEAESWRLPRVVLWNPFPALQLAIELLASKGGQQVVKVDQPNRSVPSVRWTSAASETRIEVWPNEFYAWS